MPATTAIVKNKAMYSPTFIGLDFIAMRNGKQHLRRLLGFAKVVGRYTMVLDADDDVVVVLGMTGEVINSKFAAMSVLRFTVMLLMLKKRS